MRGPGRHLRARKHRDRESQEASKRQVTPQVQSTPASKGLKEQEITKYKFNKSDELASFPSGKHRPKTTGCVRRRLQPNGPLGPH